MADGTLVATQELPSAREVPSFLAVSDVLGTGWFAADAANVKPGGGDEAAWRAAECDRGRGGISCCRRARCTSRSPWRSRAGNRRSSKSS